MLNERLEYNLYLTKGYGGLILGENLKDGLKGIKWVLTLLARGFIDICRENQICDIKTIDTYTEAFLKVWILGEKVSGLNDVKLNETIETMSKNLRLRVQLQNAQKVCLLEHMNRNNIVVKGKITNTDELRFKFLLEKVEKWNEWMFKENADSLNAIRFKSVIANAFHNGSLTNKVLLIKKSNSRDFGWQGDKIKENKKYLLGIIVVYLQKKFHDCQTVPITLSDISNYINKNASSKKASKSFDSVSALLSDAGYKYNGSPLFYRSNLLSSKNSGSKLSVNPMWLKDYDVHLMSAEEEVPEGYLCFDDSKIRNQNFT